MLKIINYELEGNCNLRIAHFSDIHYAKDFNDKKLEKIILALKKMKIDYICITGDLVDNLGVTNLKCMEKFLDFLDELSKLSKVIIGLGNHDNRDYKKMKDNKWYEKLNKNLILLNNTYYDDDNICFYGLTINKDYYCHEASNVLNLYQRLSEIKLNSSKYNILLFHSPLNFTKEEIAGINNFDLVLAGHTHNGLTPHIFPGNFGFIEPHHGLYIKNARNSFKSGKSLVIISGGITKLPKGTGIFHIFDGLYASDLNYISIKKDKKN